MYEANGKVHKLWPVKQVSERFSKREFVLMIDPGSKYPQYVQFEATGDRMAQLDDIGIGDEVHIEFSLRGREWTKGTGDTKYFTTLDVGAVKVTKKLAPSAFDAPKIEDDGIPF